MKIAIFVMSAISLCISFTIYTLSLIALVHKRSKKYKKCKKNVLFINNLCYNMDIGC